MNAKMIKGHIEFETLDNFLLIILMRYVRGQIPVSLFNIRTVMTCNLDAVMIFVPRLM